MVNLKDLNYLNLLAAREAALRDPDDACLVFGMTRSVAQDLADLEPVVVRKIADECDTTALFSMRHKESSGFWAGIVRRAKDDVQSLSGIDRLHSLMLLGAEG